MKDNWKSILIALTIFCAGLVTGVLTQRHIPMRDRGPFPERPMDFHAMQEFGKSEGDRHRMPHLPPEIQAYEEKIQGIMDSYRKKIRDVLTSAQKTEYDKLIDERVFGPKEGHGPEGERFGEGPHHMPPPVGPLRFAGMVIYKPVLEHLTQTLQLDAKQKAAIQSIMEERRVELLKFVDNNPPPTIKLMLKCKDDKPPFPPDFEDGKKPKE